MERIDLELIRDDANSTPEERHLAQLQLERLYPGSVNPEAGNVDTLDVSDLEAELLAAVKLSSLALVSYPDLHAFCSARKWDANSKELFERWADVAPEAEKTIRKAREILFRSFTHKFDYLLAELRTALDAKQDITELQKDIRAFCEDWQDSCVLDEVTQTRLRNIARRIGGGK